MAITAHGANAVDGISTTITQTPGDNSTKLATTAFVQNAISTITTISTSVTATTATIANNIPTTDIGGNIWIS